MGCQRDERNLYRNIFELTRKVHTSLNHTVLVPSTIPLLSITSPLQDFLFAIQKTIGTPLLTADDPHIFSMVTDATNGCSVLAGEEVKVAGGVAVYII